MFNKACDEHRGSWKSVIGDDNDKIDLQRPSYNANVQGSYDCMKRARSTTLPIEQKISVNNSFFLKIPNVAGHGCLLSSKYNKVNLVKRLNLRK